MHPDELPGIGFTALVIIGHHAVDEKTGALMQLINRTVIHEHAAAGEHQHHQIGFQILTAGHVAFAKLQVTGFLHIEKGRAGEGAGRLNPPPGAFQVGIREFIKIVFHGK